MNQTLSLRPTQPGRLLVVLAALGFTALVGLAALDPAAKPGRPALPAAPADARQSLERDPALRTVEPGALGASAPHFERSDEPAIEIDSVKPYGG